MTENITFFKLKIFIPEKKNHTGWFKSKLLVLGAHNIADHTGCTKRHKTHEKVTFKIKKRNKYLLGITTIPKPQHIRQGQIRWHHWGTRPAFLGNENTVFTQTVFCSRRNSYGCPHSALPQAATSYNIANTVFGHNNSITENTKKLHHVVEKCQSSNKSCNNFTPALLAWIFPDDILKVNTDVAIISTRTAAP